MKQLSTLVGISLVTMSVLIIAPFIGQMHIHFSSVFNPPFSEVEAGVFWRIRVPRVLTAFLSGAGLAISGMVFQAMFRNPLASPFTLGTSSGASFGAAVYFRLGIPFSVLGLSGASFFAFLGALFSILIVYSVAKVKKGVSSSTMLLAGVAVSFFFSSTVLFLQYMSDFSSSFRIIRWLMGGLDLVGFDTAIDIFPFVMAGSAIIFYLCHELNLITLGDDIAISRGVDIERTKDILFVATTFVVGGIVSFIGPIGFVGMMSPHICRLLIGPDHKFLAPATFLFGGMFLVSCDMLSRILIAPAEVPVGIITALLGGPFFLWLLLARS